MRILIMLQSFTQVFLLTAFHPTHVITLLSAGQIIATQFIGWNFSLHNQHCSGRQTRRKKLFINLQDASSLSLLFVLTSWRGEITFSALLIRSDLVEWKRKFALPTINRNETKVREKRENPSDFESYSKHFITQHVTRRTLMLILLFHFSSIFVLLAFFQINSREERNFQWKFCSHFRRTTHPHRANICIVMCYFWGNTETRNMTKVE